MSPVQIIFLIAAISTLGAALMVVTTRNLVHANLWLIVTLFGIAVFFVLLNAGFLAVAQVIIYIGAIAILMIFAIMLTRRLTSESRSQINQNWGWAALIVLVLFGGLIWMLTSWQGFSTAMPALSAGAEPLHMLGTALVSPDGYVLPFEVASVLLLSAMVGAIMVAWGKK